MPPKLCGKLAIKPINWLIGEWKSVRAHGKYLGNESSEYRVKMEFKHCDLPCLSYCSNSWLEDQLCHQEVGFLKIKPDTNKLCFVLAQNYFGATSVMTSIEEGTVKEYTIKLSTTGISRMMYAKQPIVCEIVRKYKLTGNLLKMKLCMATSTEPMTEHLSAFFQRTD